MVRGGLQAIYLSGWQVAAEANLAGHTYPDQSLYPANSVPDARRRLNNALIRADQIDAAEGRGRHVLARADRRRRRGRLRRGAERVRADEGHDRVGRGGRPLRGSARGREEVRPSRRQGARPDLAVHPHARLPRDWPPTCSTCRRCSSRAPTRSARRCSRATSTRSTQQFINGERTAEGFFRVRDGLDAGDRAVARLRAVCRPPLVRDLDARPRRGARVRRGDPRGLPGEASRLQLLARRSTGSAPSTTRRSPSFRETLAELGYRFQFITLAGFHSLNAAMFELARDFAAGGMSAYVRLQEREFELEEAGTRRPGISARSAPATSTGSPRSSAAARRRRWRCAGRPSPSSSSTKPLSRPSSIEVLGADRRWPRCSRRRARARRGAPSAS